MPTIDGWCAHVSSINRCAYPQLKNFRAIIPFLDMEPANTATHAFVSSHLDAGNSILYGIAQGQLQCIQRTQNTDARIITNTRQYEHITPVLQQLHWLPIQEPIEFKVVRLFSFWKRTFKTFLFVEPYSSGWMFQLLNRTFKSYLIVHD